MGSQYYKTPKRQLINKQKENTKGAKNLPMASPGPLV